MASPSKAVQEFMAKYKIASDEIWEVHGSTWVVKHKALERVAAEVGIIWDRPAMIETSSQSNTAVICVFGKLGERSEWSIGEAAPSNYKVSGKMSAYPYAMAEKRGKDRVILKLLNANASLYSEAEADEFEERSRQNPHVTRPDDVFAPVERDQHGQPVDNIQQVQPGKKLTVAEQRPIFAALQSELQATDSIKALSEYGESQSFLDRFALLKADWREFLRGVYAEHKQALRQLDLGDDMRMAG